MWWNALIALDMTFFSRFSGNVSARRMKTSWSSSKPSWPRKYLTRTAGTMLAARWVFLRAAQSHQCSWTCSFTSWTSSYLSPSSGCQGLRGSTSGRSRSFTRGTQMTFFLAFLESQKHPTCSNSRKTCEPLCQRSSNVSHWSPRGWGSAQEVQKVQLWQEWKLFPFLIDFPKGKLDWQLSNHVTFSVECYAPPQSLLPAPSSAPPLHPPLLIKL